MCLSTLPLHIFQSEVARPTLFELHRETASDPDVCTVDESFHTSTNSPPPTSFELSPVSDRSEDELVPSDQDQEEQVSSPVSEQEDQIQSVVLDRMPLIESHSTEISQHFDCSLYEGSNVAAPLYEGANVTVFEAVAHHLQWFTAHPGTSKDALSDILHTQHYKILPQPNMLPSSYSAAMKVVEPFLVQPLVLDVCQNDCVIFRGKNATLNECPVCNSKRYKRRFLYLPLGPRLERIFGTRSLAKLVQDHEHLTSTSDEILYDVQSSPIWKAAYSTEGVFRGDCRGIAFGLCADGVNPFSHLRTTYSMCPIVLSLLNLPRSVRYNFGNLFLVGIVPGNGRQEAKSIQPYLEVLVDELISLSHRKLYDTYQQAEFELKVEVLQFILDYPGIAKVFNINGAGAYKGCAWCNIRGRSLLSAVLP